MREKRKNPRWVDASTAICKIDKGKRIFVGSGAAEPNYLINELMRHSERFWDNEVVHLFTLGKAPYVEEKYSCNFRHNAFFIGANVRDEVSLGQADYTPIFLSEIPRLFYSGQMPLHCALIQVSPPDKNNCVSLGVSVDIVLSAIKNSELVIAQVNPKMPRTFAKAEIPLDMIDYLVEKEEDILELAVPEIDLVSKKIGEHITRLIGDGDTLQLGIGKIPNALLANLKNKNDLGIHTEMFSDGVIDLCKNGNINNRKKGIHNGVSVTSFVFGTQRLYNFVHENSQVEFYPSEYVNDPYIISQNKQMVSINSAIQLDLTGQVCADSMGTKFFSGIGGQVDFVRGARRSIGGRSIIALPSTAKGDKISRIVPQLSAGAGVVTSRGDVEYIVTEYGIAYLHGRSIRERGLSLAQIAHPKFREELLSYLKQKHYVYTDQNISTVENEKIQNLIPESKTFRDKTIYFRLLQPSDERAIQDFFYSHDPETVYYRYLYPKKNMPHKEAKNLVTVDYNKDMAVAGFDSPHPFAKMVCIARYIREKDNSAEKATVIRHEYQRMGIGSFLMELLIKTAQAQGISELKSYVSRSNSGMIHILKKYGFAPRWEEKYQDDVYFLAINPEESKQSPLP